MQKTGQSKLSLYIIIVPKDHICRSWLSLCEIWDPEIRNGLFTMTRYLKHQNLHLISTLRMNLDKKLRAGLPSVRCEITTICMQTVQSASCWDSLRCITAVLPHTCWICLFGCPGLKRYQNNCRSLFWKQYWKTWKNLPVKTLDTLIFSLLQRAFLAVLHSRYRRIHIFVSQISKHITFPLYNYFECILLSPS